MEDNNMLLEIHGNIVNKGYENSCNGVGENKDNLEMMVEGTDSYLKVLELDLKSDKQNAEVEKIKAESDLKKAETEKLRLELSDEQRDANIKKFQLDYEFREAELAKIRSETQLNELRSKAEINRIKVDTQVRLKELDKLDFEMRHERFRDISSVVIGVATIAAPVATAIIGAGAGIGLCCLKHHQLKDTMSFNSKLQDEGWTSIPESKFVDVSLNDFKNVK